MGYLNKKHHNSINFESNLHFEFKMGNQRAERLFEQANSALSVKHIDNLQISNSKIKAKSCN